jgi:hypothetical protein
MTHGGSIPPTDGTDSGPHSIVRMSIGMGTSMDITPGGMEWTELAKRKRRRPHKYVIPGMAQLAIQAIHSANNFPTNSNEYNWYVKILCQPC